ncbi:MAG TPA: hypothetical protein VGL00_04940 [Terracidiphilus sp.]
MNKIAWLVAAAAIITGLGAAVVPVTGDRIEDAHAQELAPPPAQPELKVAPATPIAEKKAELGDDQTWNPEWDLWIEAALPADLLSPKVARSVKPFCPRFTALAEGDKRAFWAYFFQALAGAEAGLVPTRDVRHMDPVLQVKDDVTHRMIRQEGLLQLTYMDQERYGCDFDWEKDKELDVHDARKTILQPKNNLLCGVNIIRNQLIDQHKPLLSPTSYFATLQPGTISVKVFLKQMANVPAVCRRPVHTEPQSVPQTRVAEQAPAAPAPPAASALRSGPEEQSSAILPH